jgi:acyl carrier protein
MGQRTVEDVIIEFLAEVGHTTPAELRRCLLERGDELPIDSLRTVEVLVRVQNHFEVRLPINAETAHCLRSVTTFAAKVNSLIDETRHKAVQESA